jgi:hypothetical protein
LRVLVDPFVDFEDGFGLARVVEGVSEASYAAFGIADIEAIEKPGWSWCLNEVIGPDSVDVRSYRASFDHRAKTRRDDVVLNLDSLFGV